jgi:hypothetical protein
MKAQRPSRLCLGAALLLLLASAPAFARGRGYGRQHGSPPPAVLKPARPTVPRPGARLGDNQQHLAQWMENHRNLSPADQQRALENEPGFHDLPPQTQQRMRDRLAQLNNMNPEQRDRTLDRTEALERLTPQQRQQWRGAVQQLNSLQPARRLLAARAILDLREMPPEQRQQVIDSPRFRAQFSDEERSMIGTLLTAEPYHARNEVP